MKMRANEWEEMEEKAFREASLVCPEETRGRLEDARPRHRGLWWLASEMAREMKFREAASDLRAAGELLRDLDLPAEEGEKLANLLLHAEGCCLCRRLFVF